MLGLVYRLFKLLYDGTGLIWQNKWALGLKSSVNSQCKDYLIKLQQADNDSFAVLLRGLLIVTAIVIYMLSAVSINVGIFKTLAVNSILVASSLIMYAIVACDTVDEFWGKIKGLFKWVTVVFLVWCLIFIIALIIATVAQCYLQYTRLGIALNDKLVWDVTLSQISHVSTTFYVSSLLAFLSPFAFLGIVFLINRKVIFPALRKVIAKTLRVTSGEPMKMVSIIISCYLAVKFIQSNMFK